MVNIGSLTMTVVAGTATEETDDEETLFARCSNRVLRERQSEETGQAGGGNSEVAEEKGMCPMCQQEMGMERLLHHAANCQG